MKGGYNIMFEIFLEFSAYFALLAGVLGMVLFGLMIKSLVTLKQLGSLLNRVISTQGIEKNLNQRISMEWSQWVIKYPTLSGPILCLVSTWIFIFLVFNFNSEEIIAALKLNGPTVVVWNICLQSLQWIGIVGIVGVFWIGIALIMNPNLVEMMCTAVDQWFDIDEALSKKLDKTVSKDIDTISFLRSKTIGWAGFIFSSVLFTLSLANLLKYFLD